MCINEDGTLHVKCEDGDEIKTLDTKWIRTKKANSRFNFIEENNIKVNTTIIAKLNDWKKSYTANVLCINNDGTLHVKCEDGEVVKNLDCENGEVIKRI